ncbi:MAG: NAD(P)-binding domain-containing protein [Armatimonadetes bacterium]|nr:NAD(P)-binding domain-containing protein [Armatimonadota bacterium]
MSKTPENSPLDLLIVGAGPAGLAAGCAAQDAGLRFLIVERAGLVQSLVEHPQQIRYFSPADELAIGGVPFPMAGGHKPTREDALAYYRAVAASRRLPLATWEEVTDVRRDADGLFHVRSVRRVAQEGETAERTTRFLLVCSGTFPNPRRLDVPGGDLPKVLLKLDDPTPFFGRDVLVYGGGNSAATAGMTLAEAGANVTVAMRRAPSDFQSHLRPFIVRDLKIMAEEKRLRLISDVRVSRVEPSCVELVHAEYGKDPEPEAGLFYLPNDFVFALIGQTADVRLFAHLGVPLAHDGLPEYDEKTAETAVPGLYVAGSLSRANIILESRRRAVEIVAEIVERLRQSRDVVK